MKYLLSVSLVVILGFVTAGLIAGDNGAIAGKKISANSTMVKKKQVRKAGADLTTGRITTKIPYFGTIRIVKSWSGGGVPLITTCQSSVGESCQEFAVSCLASGGYYDGDNNGGMCCTGDDHPLNDPDSPCN